MAEPVLDPAQLEQRIDEIDRAITTRAPSALDTALLLVERKSAYETLYPDAGHGGDRRSKDWRGGIKTKTISFCSATAQRLGISERLVQLNVALGESIAPYADILRKSPICDNGLALRSFVGLEDAARGAVLRVWRDEPALGWQAVLVRARLAAEADAEETQFRALVAGFQRASSRARRRFLVEIGLDDAATEQLVDSWRKGGAK